MSQGLLTDMELLKKNVSYNTVMENSNKVQKIIFQNSTEYRKTHFNISVAVICNRDKKDKFAVNLLWIYLLCWFTLVTRFLYYIPATCVTKRLLIFNILCSRFENMEIWTLNWRIRLSIFLGANDNINYIPMSNYKHLVIKASR